MEALTKPQASRLRGNVKKHPFLLLAGICVACAVLFDQTAEALSLSGVVAVCAATAACIAFSVGLRGKHIVVCAAAVFAALCAGTGGAVLWLGKNHSDIALTAVCVAALGLCFLWLGVRAICTHAPLPEEDLLRLIFAAAFLVRLLCVLYTSVSERQHDLMDPNGHMDYILYLFQNKSLPDADPRTMWQFYHPPLYHAASALWLKVWTALGMGWGRALETLQCIPLLCSAACVPLTQRIARAVGLRGKALLTAVAVAAFYPALLFNAASLNNDMMAAAFSLAALAATLEWQAQPTVQAILKIALYVGLGMMSKLSAALVTPAIALVFLCQLVRSRKKPLPLIGQYAAFGAVCVPLGMWWSLRCFFRYGMPLTYVPNIGVTDPQYVGGYSVLQRLLTGSGLLSGHVFTAWADWDLGNGTPFYEYNPLAALLKTAMFGAWDYTGCIPGGKWLYLLLFYTHLLLAAVALAALIWFLCSRGTELTHKLLLGGCAAVVFGSYVQFCFIYPYTCSMNARYTLPLFAIGAVCLGWAAEKLPKSAAHVLCSLCGAFCVLSAVVYIGIGFGA